MQALQFLFRPAPAGRLFGIPILVMPVVLLLTLTMVAYTGYRAGYAGVEWMVSILGILGVALLTHELGHALVARRLGVVVLDITIWPLGGMARLQDVSHRPSAEAPIALAGPLVNLVQGGIFALIPGPLAMQATWVNLVLAAGNLLPAFPLDGGRVLRAWLARRSPIVDATRAAMTVGTGLAVALVVTGFLLQAPFLGLLLAVYVWWAGRAEFFQLILRTRRLPRMAPGEVFRRALARKPGRAPHPEGREPGPGAAREEPPIHGDLERFRGRLSEYFRRRQQGR